MISLELTDLLDDILVFLEEFKSADSDPNGEISISVQEPRQQIKLEEKNHSKKQTEEWE